MESVNDRDTMEDMITFGQWSLQIQGLTYNACQKSWNTDVNFQGQNQSSPSPLQNNVGLLSNGLGF